MNSCRFVKALILGAIGIHSITFADENQLWIGIHRSREDQALAFKKSTKTRNGAGTWRCPGK
jgi:hypothetical protein